MIPNLDFMRTVLEGIRESLLARLKSAVRDLEGKIAAVERTAAAAEKKILDVKAGIPHKVSELENDVSETDPTVPAWAKAASKPTYTASEVGAAAADHAHTDYVAQKAPVFTESVSMGRKGNTTVGANSTALGNNVEASNQDAHAEGYYTTASGFCAHAEGRQTKAGGNNSHAEGYSAEARGTTAHAEGRSTVASGDESHAEGQECHATAVWSHAEGYKSEASGSTAHAEGSTTAAKGYATHAEGYHTIAGSDYQHVQGMYNVEDTGYLYAHIVGNGTEDTARSNAHTLDWHGNAWFAGTVEGLSLILKSAGGKYFTIWVDDNGTLITTELIR